MNDLSLAKLQLEEYVNLKISLTYIYIFKFSCSVLRTIYFKL